MLADHVGVDGMGIDVQLATEGVSEPRGIQHRAGSDHASWSKI